MKYAKFLIAVFCLMIFAMADEVRATPIFDGGFKPTDYRQDANHWIGSYGTGYNACLPRSNSLVVVPAPRRPGEYAGKFTLNDGDACNSAIGDERAQIAHLEPSVAGQTLWYGWSQMLDPAWQTSDAWIVYFGTLSEHKTAPGEFQINSATTTASKNRDIYVQTNAGQGGVYQYAQKIISAYEIGVWHDWMLHVKWTQDSTGFFEVYYRKEGQSNYALVYSKYNIPTLQSIPGYPNDRHDTRQGVYRGNTATGTVILYAMGLKIGTTRADVEYGGTSTPNPTDTAPPTISITCPTSGTYSSQTISVSGTASDTIGVSKVEVKAGTGSWRTAAGTTSWSVSGIALAGGANTVTARATDAAGNTKETSITVTYNPSATQPSGTLLFDGKFMPDDHRIDKNHWSAVSWGAPLYNACLLRANSLMVVPAPSGRTGYAGQFTIMSGETCNSAIGDERAMIASPKIDSPEGSEHWFSFSTYIPNTFQLSGSTWNMIFQTKDKDDSFVNTALYVSSSKGNIFWNVRYGYPAQYVDFPSSMAVYGWSDWLVHIKWSSSNSGEIEYYRNGVSILSKSGIRTIANNPVYYLPNGFYRNPQPTTNTLYLTEVKAGKTRADVEYGTSGSGGNPTPACTAPTTNPNPQPTSTSLTLKPGWNQISSSIAAGINLATIESSCTILQYKNQKLWAWNAQAQSWTNPTKVEPFRGYWIYAAYTCTVPISGTPATFSSLQLYNGWNKVSAQGSLSAIAGTCAGHITGSWIWNWDKATEKWIHPATMQLDKGYWIKVDADCVLG